MNERIVITDKRGRDDQVFLRPPELAEFVPVIFAEGLARAQRIKNVLEELGIPTIVHFPEYSTGRFAMPAKRTPVLVPEDMHDDASEVVARMEKEITAGFDDDDDDDDLDDDFFDDDDDDLDDDYGDDEELYDDDDDDLENDE